MKMIRKLLSVVLALAMLLSIAGMDGGWNV